MPHPEEEYQISRDKGQVMDAIATFFCIGRRQRAGWKVSEILLEPLLEPCWLEPWWNLAGTSPEPCWKISGTLLELCWNLVKPCWNLAGTLSLEPLAGTFCWEPIWVSILFFFLHFLLCLLCRVVMLEVWLELCWNRDATLLEPIWGQLLVFFLRRNN